MIISQLVRDPSIGKLRCTSARRLNCLALLALLLQVSTALGQDIPLANILVDKENWRVVAKGWPSVTFLEADASGALDVYQGKLSGRVEAGGAIDRQPLPKKVLPDKQTRIVRSQGVYTIAGDGKEVHALLGQTATKLHMKGLTAPGCLTMWPDGGHLVIAPEAGAWLWAVRIEQDGAFGPGDRYYSLRAVPGRPTQVHSMIMDASYLLYAATPLGIQVFDPTGRLCGAILAPGKEAMTALAIGGPHSDTLFVASGESIYGRRIQGKASYTLKK